ncbi:TetR family transcriptional regulator [Paenibacillus sp. GCM10023248]|uniref:TetR family transcriptional regulator n=1 Tax=Bacillales TaxID=1385 RepID=UPI002378B618|nr:MULTISPECIES: TetR family transcriptional regulator [Bacillales]MDD9267257.1 TetR family transcriptional regulator [Paenibacillus sp. MAHUQ-63]MDR6881471.1 AcrR family transcriptional regulator [Bacillus sp. 3255]
MRNAEATRERILEAAKTEFAAYGIAGARVDRIAKTAGCNKNMIYIYFESKEKLFTTVLQMHLTRVYEELVFTPEDLPGYAARVFDFTMANPDLMRLMAWFSLEQKADSPDVRSTTHDAKIVQLAKAQSSGLIGDAFSPNFIMTVVMALATAWTATNPFGPSLDPESAKQPDELRDGIAMSVKLIAEANKQPE